MDKQAQDENKIEWVYTGIQGVQQSHYRYTCGRGRKKHKASLQLHFETIVPN